MCVCSEQHICTELQEGVVFSEEGHDFRLFK